MASSSKPAKSILKKRIDDTTTPQQSNASIVSVDSPLAETIASANPAHLATALYHANLIQRRKDLELDILYSTETLLDYPTTDLPATSPSPSDISTIKQLIRPFQPSDFDALLDERRINNRCAYVLCPNPSPARGSNGGYRLFGTSGKSSNFRIVPAAEADLWCSEDCARRAMYLKVQLSETPAWERDGGYGGELELLGEREALSERQRLDERLADDLKNLDIISDPEGRGVEERRDLALERGEMAPDAVMRGGLVNVEVREKQVTGQAVPPSFEDEFEDEDEQVRRRFDAMQLKHEGYASR
ncbi:hypothetical protein V494_06973 [Pseudogymnoascus sp. VKM F-4513 (FW-928)]|nr:hypothetical protein V494_06973 [Pseudogymnoascus sp. VKM F-4513 (FW-928)]